jgi:hypothetical protein
MAKSSRELYWSAVLADFRSSGLTHVGFCKLRGISVHSFRDWLYRLRPGLPPPRPRACRQLRSPGASQVPSPSFLPVHIRRDPPRPLIDQSRPQPPAPPLELILTDDLRVLLPADFEAGSLHRLLDVLEQRS